MSRLLAGVPVTPDRAQGRQWLARELAGPEYREAQGSWLVRAWAWLQDRLSAGPRPGPGHELDGRPGASCCCWRRSSRWSCWSAGRCGAAPGSGPPDAVFDAAPEPSGAHFARADAAAAAGDWDLAVAERFRGLVRSLEERTLIDSRPGRTAGEIAARAATTLPGCAEALTRAARTFDDVRYGGRPAGAGADEDLRAVVRAVAAARPAVPA